MTAGDQKGDSELLTGPSAPGDQGDGAGTVLQDETSLSRLRTRETDDSDKTLMISEDSLSGDKAASEPCPVSGNMSQEELTRATVHEELGPARTESSDDRTQIIDPGKSDSERGEFDFQQTGDGSADGLLMEERTFVSKESAVDYSGKDAPSSEVADVPSKGRTSGSWVDEAELASDSPETRIGRFYIEKKLGEGAFGTVYLAKDRQLDRQVAIKVAKVGVFNARADIDRFLREARSAAQLRHPNIVPVYEVGTYRQSNFIAYQFVKGQTLSGYLKQRKKLDPREAALLARKMASALHYAHSYGIVHRDMKPDNVLLDQDGEPHIADFGLARMETDVSKTREGLLMGTPLYMSPEQASGHGNTADGRSDVWSMGVILEEMLTGSRPFKGNLTQILSAIQNEEPPPLRRIDGTLPRDLETIVQKCLAKKVEERYQSAQDLADELDRYLRGEPILARPIGLLERLGRWSRRNPLVAGLIGAVCLTLFLGTVVSTFFAIQARQNAAQAREAERGRSIDQLITLQTAVPGSLGTILKALNPVREDVRERVNELLESSSGGSQEQRRVRLAAVTLYPDAPQTEEILQGLAEDLLEAEGPELVAIATLLEGHAEDVGTRLWQRMNAGELSESQRFRALAVLARTAPGSVDWSRNAEIVVRGLMALNILEIGDWLPAFTKIRDNLRETVESQFTTSETTSSRRQAAILGAEMYGDQPEWLFDRVRQATPEQVSPLLTALKPFAGHLKPQMVARLDELLAERDSGILSDDKAREAGILGLVALEIGLGDVARNVLRGARDRSARTEMIQLAVDTGVSAGTVLGFLGNRALVSESESGVVSGLVQMLGTYPVSVLSREEQAFARRVVEDLFATHPESGVHGACEWVLRRWGFSEVVEANQREMATAEPVESRDWHVDPIGGTFLVVRGPVEFRMGVSEHDPYVQTDPTTMDYERPHWRRIPRSFGIGQTEVTLRDFLRFREDHVFSPEYTRAPDGPVIQVTWWDAVKYCRWLSEQAGIPEDQMCYPPMDKIGPGMPLPDDLLRRRGYRLPTAAEWEYAARAGTHTRRPFGTSNRYVGRYCRFNLNSEQHAWPVFDLPPNDWGLFAMQGNVLEWSQDWYFDSYPIEQDVAGAQGGRMLVIDGLDDREGFSKELRGGDSTSLVDIIRVSDRDEELPDLDSYVIGFRIARTYGIE